MNTRKIGDLAEHDFQTQAAKHGLKFVSTKGSGQTRGDGDFTDGYTFVEVKHKNTEGFSLPLGEFNKARKQAENNGRTTVVIVRRNKHNQMVAIVPVNQFFEMYGTFLKNVDLGE